VKQLLAIGAAIALIIGSIAALVASLALLASQMQNMEINQMITFFLGSAVLIIGIIWALIPAIGALGTVSAAAALPILAVGGAIFFLGAGIALIIGSLAYLIDRISNLVAMGESMAEVFGQLLGFMFGLSGALIQLSGAMLVLAATGPAVLAFTVAALGLVGALWLLGRASGPVAENFTSIGTGINVLTSSSESAKSALEDLKAGMQGFEIPENFNQLITTFLMLGVVANRFSDSISIIGRAMLQLGQGIKTVSENIEGVIGPLSELLNMMADANAQAIDNFTATLQAEAEMQETQPRNVQNTPAAAAIEPRVQPNIQVEAEQQAQNNSTVLGKFDIANSHLENIEGYLENMWNKMKDNNNTGGIRNIQPATDVGGIG
jgi:hypothetical protein